jgi:hypothetical protein
MEVGEAVAVVIADTNHDQDCYFCKAKDEQEEVENDLEESPSDDDEGYGGFKNDASKLGRSLGGSPDQKTAAVNDSELPITVAAHHLIPGNAALKKSTLFKSNEYLWVDGKKRGNIGYNVNSLDNGVWLPGNYAVSGWSGKADAFKTEYSQSAIERWRRQFHDAHEKYSEFVLEALEKVYEKIDSVWCVACPEAQQQKEKPTPEERPPLRALVARLNTISGRMRRMLVAPTANWKKNVYTSSRSLTYMDTKPHFD